MKRTKANLSHYRLSTVEFGQLLPVGCVEVLPGDSFQHATSLMLRCAPMLAPVMHQVNVRVHHFFVPNRLTWSDWEDFITEKNPALTIPQAAYNPSQPTDWPLFEALGCPVGDGYPNAERLVNALPIRAYNLIYNEFYRDQDLSPERDLADETLANVAWNKDYFTAARPWPQKGGSVTIPLGTSAPVMGYRPEPPINGKTPFAADMASGNIIPVQLQGNDAPTGNPVYHTGGSVTWDEDSAYNLYLDPTKQVGTVDLSEAASADVRDVRLAFAMQRYAEARARYGSRYTEYLRYLGVTPSDARLQRPEYLGGGKTTISFSEVLQTAEGESPVGEMRGHGIAAMRSNRYRRFFEEHGYVITLLSVVPRNIYTSITPRHFLKRNPEDFFQRELQDIGQQEVYNGELWPAEATDYGTFGYANRYSEYLSTPSQVGGEFRELLDYWHMARKFPALPVLNNSFVMASVDKRQFADSTAVPLYIFAHHQLGARRMVRKSNVGRIL